MGAVVKNLAQTKFENRCVRQWNQVKTSEKSKWWHTYGVRPLFWTEVPIRTCLNLLIMLCAPCGAHLWPYRPHTYGHQICPIWCMIWGWCGPIHTGFLSSDVCMLNFLAVLGVSDFLIFRFEVNYVATESTTTQISCIPSQMILLSSSAKVGPKRSPVMTKASFRWNRYLSPQYSDHASPHTYVIIVLFSPAFILPHRCTLFSNLVWARFCTTAPMLPSTIT